MGKVYLMGAGPGAEDLLTLRAARLLAEADIVFYDALANPDILALAARAQRVDVGKRCAQHSARQGEINQWLIDAARTHACVVRLKGGDPMMFGRAQEEIDALVGAGIEVEVVPGVTSALAAAAELGISLTCRGVARSVAFVTPRVGEEEDPSEWLQAVLGADTAVIYMALAKAADIVRELSARGYPTDMPLALVESASLPQRRILFGRLDALTQLAARTGPGPVIVVMGRILEARLPA